MVKSLRVLFAGSLPDAAADDAVVRRNLAALVQRLASDGCSFVIRDARRDNPARTPIDHLISDALNAFVAQSGNWIPDRLVVYKEPGIMSGSTISLAHRTHAASTSYRIEFYRELLELVDVVVGVGGELGLLRMSISAEWMRKPCIVLPGSGGTAELLWHELFRKSHQLRALNDIEKRDLKQMPYVNETSESYADGTRDVIYMFCKAVTKRFENGADVVTPENVTIPVALASLRRFSISLWLLLVGFLASALGAAFDVGKHFCK